MTDGRGLPLNFSDEKMRQVCQFCGRISAFFGIGNTAISCASEYFGFFSLSLLNWGQSNKTHFPGIVRRRFERGNLLFLSPPPLFFGNMDHPISRAQLAKISTLSPPPPTHTRRLFKKKFLSGGQNDMPFREGNMQKKISIWGNNIAC